MMDAHTKLCGLIGNPVLHSISPLIHNTLADRMNINLSYNAFCVQNEDLHDAVKGAYALGILGMNVTVPHKCSVISELSDIDELAGRIGAVNTLVRTGTGYKGYNTDIIGLHRELQKTGVSIEKNSFIIIGAGGASRAITYLCASKNAKKIWLLNRNLGKAEELAREVNSCFGDIVTPLQIDNYSRIPSGKYPVIQTTSVGMYPNTGEAAIMKDEFYSLVDTGIDIIFNPYETEFMKKCSKAGAKSYNGLMMLLYQGVASFELWNNVQVPEEYVDEIYDLMRKELMPNG